MSGTGTSGGDATYFFAPQHQSANSMSQGSLHGAQPLMMAHPPQSSGVTLSSLLGQGPASTALAFPPPQQVNANAIPHGSYVFVQQQQQQQQPVMQYSSNSAASPTQFIFHNAQNSGSGSGFLVADGNASGHMQQLSQSQPYQLSPLHQPLQQMQSIQYVSASYPPPQHVSQAGMFAVPQGMTQPHGLMMSPPPPPYAAQNHQFLLHNTASDGNPVQGGAPPRAGGGLADIKKTKRSKKRKDVLLTPRSQAQKDKEAKDREDDKANRGGKPFSEEPFELDSTKKQLIVNFLSHAVTETEFTQIFSQFGPISAARIIYDKHTNRSKGYGFVYFKTGEDAIKAIIDLNGMEVHSKFIKVSYATPQRPTPPNTPRGDADAAAGDEDGDGSDEKSSDESEN
jgi:hypothetical protein